MSKQREKIESAILFDSFYRELYGSRWETLKEALLNKESEKLTPEGLRAPYYMDRASILTASILPIKENDHVLDMCAAPGGKTLILAKKLGGTGSLTSNDRSPDRRRRLRETIENCLEEKERNNIKVTGFDGSLWGLYERESYDAVLLDAPCSSERHVLTDPKHLSLWSPSRPKRLAKEQYALLCSAGLVLKKGGYILYSTCSINRDENEGVIERFLTKKQGFEEVPVSLELGERREHGLSILPDLANGSGPMYLCLLRKNEDE